MNTDTTERSDWYDEDPDYNYLHHWHGRGYEHAAEELALRRMLRGVHSRIAVDVGGGYGRLTTLLCGYAEQVILAEPSRQQRELAAQFLPATDHISCQPWDAAHLPLPDSSVDLIVMIRVVHHIPDPQNSFTELARVLAPGGTLILEFANSANAARRIRAALTGHRIHRAPTKPGRHTSGNPGKIPFLNHHPATITAALQQAGLQTDRALSVCNLRTPLLTQLPLPALLTAERLLQPTLAPLRFGPSIWLRLHPSRVSHDVSAPRGDPGWR